MFNTGHSRIKLSKIVQAICVAPASATRTRCSVWQTVRAQGLGAHICVGRTRQPIRHTGRASRPTVGTQAQRWHTRCARDARRTSEKSESGRTTAQPLARRCNVRQGACQTLSPLESTSCICETTFRVVKRRHFCPHMATQCKHMFTLITRARGRVRPFVVTRV